MRSLLSALFSCFFGRLSLAVTIGTITMGILLGLQWSFVPDEWELTPEQEQLIIDRTGKYFELQPQTGHWGSDPELGIATTAAIAVQK